MSFLSKLSELKKTIPTEHTKVINNKPADKVTSLLPKNYIRDEDPAVSRLKELRRQERIKNQKYVEKKKPTRSSSTTKRVTKKRTNDMEKDVGTVYKRRIGSSGQQIKNNNVTNIRREPIKKMSFEELMKQAESQAKAPTKEKTTISKKSVEKSIQKTNVASTRLNKPGFRKRGPSVQKTKEHSKEPVSREKTPGMVHINTRVSNGFAQPHKRFQAKLDNRKSLRYAEEEYDEDLDDFIEDDEEEDNSYNRRRERNNHNRGYDRDEIWALFNRRGRGSNAVPQDDWDSDDMETNEFDIMAEEEEATKAARLEDKREQAWLRKHDEAKAKMKQKSKNQSR